MVTEAELPPHAMALPVIEAVGSGLTVTVPEPVNPPTAGQFASLRELMVKVVVEVGTTEIEAELAFEEND